MDEKRVTSLSVAQLKTELSTRGVSVKEGLVEKRDLVDALLAALRAPASAPAPAPAPAPASASLMPCVACGAPSGARCGGCRAVGFCSKACQRAAWPAHKEACRAQGAASIAALRRRVAAAELDVAACVELADVLEGGQLGAARDAEGAGALRARAAAASPAEAALHRGGALVARAREAATEIKRWVLYREAEPLLRVALAAGLTAALTPLGLACAAQGRKAEARAHLARACKLGDGVALRFAALDVNAAGDMHATSALYERAIAAGDMFAAMNLASLLFSGASGLPLDVPRAARLLSIVADQPPLSVGAAAMSAQSCYNLFYLLTGRMDTPAASAAAMPLNLRLAAKYLEASAALGDPMAQTELGICLFLTSRAEIFERGIEFLDVIVRGRELDAFLTSYGRSVMADARAAAAQTQERVPGHAAAPPVINTIEQNMQMFAMDLPRAEALLRAAATADYSESWSTWSRAAFMRDQPRAWWGLSSVIAKSADSRGATAAGVREAMPWLRKSAAAGNPSACGVMFRGEPWFINVRFAAMQAGSEVYAVHLGGPNLEVTKRTLQATGVCAS